LADDVVAKLIKHEKSRAFARLFLLVRRFFRFSLRLRFGLVLFF